MTINGVDVSNILAAVLEIIIGVVSIFVTTKIVPWLKSKIDANKLENVKEIVKSAVGAAEQLWKDDSGSGQTKLEYATDMINKALESKKIKIDADLVRSYIEAAVLELNKI
ncbi:MAG: phage holin [Methanobrevibacter sp.]|nr:phage holin [Methanobrevibacter sp.]